MKITVLKQIYVRSGIIDNEDVWIYRKYDFPFVPPIGATIENEKIKSMDIDKKGAITIYVESDKYFYDIYDAMENKTISKNEHKQKLSKYMNKVYLLKGWNILKIKNKKTN